ncbi:hypothetical protein [Bradyrhizobium lablabi]|uniref:phage tail fiber protein n=1 Tax=Bradyrhizobium lablabi TaxID=722472 RepID=UPI001BAB1E80|nr:hypothetical protein [Bradyrhizobium lablabi]MBR0693666.1 hypothetical protein [Bradyrhizobium lablabi]
MTGFSDFAAKNVLNYLTGQVPMPGTTAVPAVFLALFTAVGTDAGSFTEVTGGSYTRVQVAGTATAAGSISTASATITMPNVSGFPWVQPGMAVYDITANKVIGTVLTWVGTTLTLTANAANNGSGSTDTLSFSAFPNASGSAPSSLTNGSVISFPQASASWGNVIAWGLYDASSSGNLLFWDFMGNFAWLPFETPTGSNPTFTVKGHGYSSNDPIVFTAEYGGTLPTASTGVFTGYNILFAAPLATDTLNVDTVSGPSTPVVLTSSGSGMVRKIVQQTIPSGVTASFAASTLTLTAA